VIDQSQAGQQGSAFSADEPTGGLAQLPPATTHAATAHLPTHEQYAQEWNKLIASKAFD